MEIDVSCAVHDEVLFAHVRENSEYCGNWVKSLPAHDGHAVLVGGGPSVRGKIGAIRDRKNIGQKVFALNGVCAFLNKNGIIPDYQVLLDAQEFMPKYLGLAKEYLVASQCHPEVFKAVPDPILWHVATVGIDEHIPEYPDGFAQIGGGVTVGLCSMCLAYSLGYRNLHLYGYDSSSTPDGDHAFPNPIYGTAFDVPQEVTATMGGKRFKTTLTLAKQAQLFPNLCNNLIDLGCTVTVDGDGLIMAVVDEMRKDHLSQAA